MRISNRRREIESQEAVPVLAWLHRFSAFFFIFLGATFTIWFRLDDSFMSRARIIVSDVSRPLTLAVYGPVFALHRGIDAIDNHFDTVSKLENLQEQSQRMAVLEEEINRLEAQLEEARIQANYPQNTGYESLTLRVINNNYGAVASQLHGVMSMSNLLDRRLVKVNAGSAYGVREGMPVINDIGLVGRILESGADTATVMLVFDTASSVPALIEPLSARVTIKGTGSRDQLQVKLATSQVLSEVQVGDRIVTSGQGEVYPPGILIGTVVSLDRGVQVKPAVEWGKLMNVRILPKSGERR